MGFPSLIKPPMWALQSALVDPEWRGLWSRSIIAVPNWEKDRAPFDYIGRVLSDTSGLVQPNWKANDLGVVTRHSGSSSTSAGTARGFRLVARSNMDVSELTFMAVAKLNVATTNSQHLFNRGSGTAGSWVIFRRSIADGSSIRGQIRVNGGTVRQATIASNALPANGTQCLFAITYKAPTITTHCIPLVGGALVQATESTGGTLDTGTGNLYLGCHPNTQGIADWHDDVSYWFVSARVFPLEELQKVARDPFGLFRMVDEAALFVPAVGGVTLPIFDHHYRSMRAA